MRKFLLTLLCGLAITAFAAKKKTVVLPYQNAALPIEERLHDLMSRMTIEEKIGQLRCTMAWNYYTIQESKGKGAKEVVPSESFKKDIAEGQIGMLWATFRADPWTQKSLENGLTPELAAMAANALQRYVIEHTRLGIPLFFAEEAPHGHMAIGTTVFPTGLGMAATWSPELTERVGEVIGKEIRLQGGHISYGPVLDLSRDPRWSRVEESYGEDPVLTSELGAAMVRGLGGGNLKNPYSTLATLKHFIAYGTTEGGQNGNQTVLGPMELHQHFLPPFRKAIDAGALSVMTSYNSCDGIPCTSNEYLLTEVLRKQWNFRGFVVSDLFSIDGIAGMRVARNNREAGIMALKAGVDADLGANAFGKIQELWNEGVNELSRDELRDLEKYIDRACERILRLKFEMGLFENPYANPKIAKKEVRTAENKQVALDAARASITLLKNNGILPLKNALSQKSGMKILVVGPNADNQYNQLGDYTAPQADDNVTTVLEGLREKQLSTVNYPLSIEYVKGCAVRDTTESNIAEAVKVAEDADVIVAVVGGSSARDFETSYNETCAATTQLSSTNAQIPDMDCGEGFDRATLSLLGRQDRLLKELKKTGKPMVVVYIEGRPLDKTWAAVHADALLTAYYPGQEGGKAIADVLFGDYNPAGRLPVSVPASVGQLPVYYNKRAPRPHDYVEMSSKPLYAFGFGLSYTTFKYENLQIEAGNELKISCDVTNTGNDDGEEVVQLYVHDEIASVVQPLMQLKAFRRVMIPKGATRHVEFTLSKADLSIVDAQMHQKFEPGEFRIMLGASSDNIRLQKIVNFE